MVIKCCLSGIMLLTIQSIFGQQAYGQECWDIYEITDCQPYMPDQSCDANTGHPIHCDRDDGEYCGNTRTRRISAEAWLEYTPADIGFHIASTSDILCFEELACECEEQTPYDRCVGTYDVIYANVKQKQNASGECEDEDYGY